MSIVRIPLVAHGNASPELIDIPGAIDHRIILWLQERGTQVEENTQNSAYKQQGISWLATRHLKNQTILP